MTTHIEVVPFLRVCVEQHFEERNMVCVKSIGLQILIHGDAGCAYDYGVFLRESHSITEEWYDGHKSALESYLLHNGRHESYLVSFERGFLNQDD